MIIGIPKEIKPNEKRVSLLPHSVSQIAKLGHKVVVQKDAGMESGISDKEFENEGARTSLASAKAAFGRGPELREPTRAAFGCPPFHRWLQAPFKKCLEKIIVLY